MTTLPSSSQPRKTLASQLDRLESILDGLHDSLQRTVAAAIEPGVSAAVQQAVSQAVRETLPIALSSLHNGAAAAGKAEGATRETMRDATERNGLWTWCMVQHVRAVGDAWLRQALQHSPWPASAGTQLWRYKRHLLSACGMGLTLSFVIFWAGPWPGVAIGFLTGFLLTLLLQRR